MDGRMGKEGPGGQSPMKTVPVEASRASSFIASTRYPLDRPFSEAVLTRFVRTPAASRSTRSTSWTAPIT